MFTFTISILPANSVPSSSNEGAMARQGPHHSAQKSTSTGALDLRTSTSNVASVTGLLMGMILKLR
jgi:hypothetical protein